jgi:hypothetical protein
MTTGQSPAALEQVIGQTRTELTLTINALEDKLTPRHFVEKGFDMLNDSIGGADGVNRALAAVRTNPVPFALIAVGAAWLLASNTGIVDRVAQDERIRAVKRRAGEMASDVGNRAGEMASDLGSRAGDYASDMARRVGLGGNGTDRPLGETGHPLVDSAAERGAPSRWMHQAADYTGETIQSARDSSGALLGDAADRLNDALERNPLVVGGLGALAGAVLAMLLPATRSENDWLGGIRDTIWQRAEQAGQDAAVAVRKIAINAADAAAEAAAEVAKNAGSRPVQG